MGRQPAQRGAGLAQGAGWDEAKTEVAHRRPQGMADRGARRCALGSDQELIAAAATALQTIEPLGVDKDAAGLIDRIAATSTCGA